MAVMAVETTPVLPLELPVVNVAVATFTGILPSQIVRGGRIAIPLEEGKVAWMAAVAGHFRVRTRQAESRQHVDVRGDGIDRPGP